MAGERRRINVTQLARRDAEVVSSMAFKSLEWVIPYTI